MSNEITPISKMKSLADKCLNKPLSDTFIQNYQDSTKSAVENILNMSVSIKEINEKYKSKEITYFDFAYFCAQVSIDPKKSTFRKLSKIGEKAEQFKNYLEKLPSAYTVLYEITTLDADTFEELLSNEKLNPNLTLEDIKELSNKKLPTSSNPDLVSFNIEFDQVKISNDSKEHIKQVLRELLNFKDLEIIFPKKHQTYFAPIIRLQNP